jgi:RNA recognition motif-containing protein
MQLREALSEFGIIEEVRIQSEKGFAFLKYSTHQNAADAIARGSGYVFFFSFLFLFYFLF